MEDACGQRGIGFSTLEHLDKMSHCARPSRSNYWNAHGFTHCCGQVTVESHACTVGVHRGEQDLTGAACFCLSRPLDCTAASWLPAALHKHLRIADGVSGCGVATRIDSDNDGLRTEAVADGVNQRRIRERSGVHAHFICARFEHARRIVRRANAAADCEWHEQLE